MLPAVLRLTAVGLPLLLIAIPVPAHAQLIPEPGYAREGVYVGISPQFGATLDGVTFDGETIYQEEGGTEYGILPKLDSKTMVRLVAGFRSRPVALEFSFERATHGGRFLDEPVESTVTVINVDGRFFFRTHRRIQPHLVLGIAFPVLRVKDGAIDDSVVGNARWRGTGLNTEAGVTVFATPRFGVTLGYAYRPIWFTTVRGITDRIFELRPRFRETSANVVLMAFVTF
jgi:hypothetical protein